MTRVLVTGASGFVGSLLVPGLFRAGHQVTAVSRQAVSWPELDGVRCLAGLPLEADEAAWLAVLAGQEVIIHAAGRAHVMVEHEADALAAFRAANTEATLRLARLAAAAGVRRFIFISSIKVNGEETAPGRCFAPHDAPAPVDPYGQSKLEAEQGLRALAETAGLEVVVVRPALIYGPGAKGNLALLRRLLRWPLPLPLGRVRNRRSLLALANLTDFLELAVRHPDAPGRTFLLADVTWSTPELLRVMAAAAGRRQWLLPVPVSWLYAVAHVAGRGAWISRLCGNLEVDSSLARECLGWQPPVDPIRALRDMMKAV